MIDVGSVDSVQESQRLWLLRGQLFKRESTAALVGEWMALQKRVDSGSEGDWTILQKRIDSSSKVVGSSIKRLVHLP